MTTENIEKLEYECRCTTCGAKIDAVFIINDKKKSYIAVEPCSKCWLEGYEKGKSEGFIEGFETAE